MSFQQLYFTANSLSKPTERLNRGRLVTSISLVVKCATGRASVGYVLTALFFSPPLALTGSVSGGFLFFLASNYLFCYISYCLGGNCGLLLSPYTSFHPHRRSWLRWGLFCCQFSPHSCNLLRNSYLAIIPYKKYFIVSLPKL